MDAVESASDLVALSIGVATLLGSAYSAKRWGWPLLLQRRERARSVDAVLLGRPAIPANMITGEPAYEALPSIGQQVADLTRLVEGIHHEMHPNGGSSLRDTVDRLEARTEQIDDQLKAGALRFDEVDRSLAQLKGQVADELSVSNAALEHAAEASKTGLQVIHDAILAEPPADLG